MLGAAAGVARRILAKKKVAKIFFVKSFTYFNTLKS
jgi:hypothetical protein